MASTSNLTVAPGSSKSFRQPPLFRRLAWFGLVLCAPACPMMLAMPFVAPTTVGWPVAVFSFLFFAGGLYESIAVLRRSNDTITIDDEGIRSESPGGGVVSIPWGEVDQVETQNVMQRLVISHKTSDRRIMAEFHLQDYGTLMRTVRERAATE